MKHAIIDISELEGFEWDSGNLLKNWEKHKVLQAESEQVFFNEPLLLLDDPKHSSKEKRYFALGRTNENRLLCIVFTVRGKNIRIISSRNMSKKERHIYEQA